MRLGEKMNAHEQGLNNQPHPAQLLNPVREMVAGKADEHEIDGDFPFFGKLLDDFWPKAALYFDKLNVNDGIASDGHTDANDGQCGNVEAGRADVVAANGLGGEFVEFFIGFTCCFADC